MMEYSIYWLTIIHFQLVMSVCNRFLKTANYYTDLSNCDFQTPASDTFETCIEECAASRICSGIVVDTSFSQGHCCFLPNNTSLLVWQGSLTIYRKKARELIQKVYSNPCGSPWIAPNGWNTTGPVTHVDFTNTQCLQTFNGANVVSFFSVIMRYPYHGKQIYGGHQPPNRVQRTTHA